MKHKLTQQDYELFKAECIKWQKKLGLTDWEIYFEFKQLKGNFAECCWQYRSCEATITISKSWDCPGDFTKEWQIKSSALHEVLHILLARMEGLAKDRGWDEIEFEAHEHRVINQLSEILLEQQDHRPSQLPIKAVSRRGKGQKRGKPYNGLQKPK